MFESGMKPMSTREAYITHEMDQEIKNLAQKYDLSLMEVDTLISIVKMYGFFTSKEILDDVMNLKIFDRDRRRAEVIRPGDAPVRGRLNDKPRRVVESSGSDGIDKYRHWMRNIARKYGVDIADVESMVTLVKTLGDHHSQAILNDVMNIPMFQRMRDHADDRLRDTLNGLRHRRNDEFPYKMFDGGLGIWIMRCYETYPDKFEGCTPPMRHKLFEILSTGKTQRGEGARWIDRSSHEININTMKHLTAQITECWQMMIKDGIDCPFTEIDVFVIQESSRFVKLDAVVYANDDIDDEDIDDEESYNDRPVRITESEEPEAAKPFRTFAEIHKALGFEKITEYLRIEAELEYGLPRRPKAPNIGKDTCALHGAELANGSRRVIGIVHDTIEEYPKLFTVFDRDVYAEFYRLLADSDGGYTVKDSVMVDGLRLFAYMLNIVWTNTDCDGEFIDLEILKSGTALLTVNLKK